MAVNNLGKFGIDKDRIRMIAAAAVVIFMLYLVGTVMWSYVSAFFVALFGFVVLKPVYGVLRKHGAGKTTSAITAMILGIILVGIPMLLICGVLVSEATAMLAQANSVQYQNVLGDGLGSIQKMFPNYDVNSIINKEILGAVYQFINYFKNLLLMMLQDVGVLALQFLVAIFTLYYLLVSEDNLGKTAKEVIPFNEKNKELLFKEFNNVTYSVLVTSVFLGFFQAIPLTLILMFYQVPGAAFWGFIGFILTFIPFIGIPFIWAPIAILEALQGNYGAALGITIVGIVIGILDNARPILQNKVGQIHPLVSLLGVIIGITHFGIMGVVIGPLLLSYSLLTIKMFIEEYT